MNQFKLSLNLIFVYILLEAIFQNFSDSTEKQITEKHLGKIIGNPKEIVKSTTGGRFRLAYSTVKSNERLFVVDGQAGPEYDDPGIGNPGF